ncbi:MAG: FMN-binding protein [Oscillospiraceae bacterium]
MEKFKNGLVGPPVVLTLVCLIITFFLALTHQVTAPLIAQAEEDTAQKTRADVLPDAGGFTQITDVELPDGVSSAYAADSGVGYVFQSTTKGYKGNVTFMVGLDAEGNYTGITMLANNETPGLGSRVGEEEYLKLYVGQDNPDGVDSITGATLTSRALKNALSLSTQAYGAVTGKSVDATTSASGSAEEETDATTEASPEEGSGTDATTEASPVTSGDAEGGTQ